MTHDGTWAAFDKIAARLGLSVSGLAKGCGLDATAFNKSKRWTRYGKPRWPSTGTVAKVIAYANITAEEFIELTHE